MKLIMAVSKDGYVAREANDDMSWTGPTDKAVFRLLTSVGGDIACGSKTWSLMADLNLPGRRLWRLSTEPVPNGTPEGLLRDLAWFQREHPNGWLIGGQTVAAQALRRNLIDEAYICHSDRSCFPAPRMGVLYNLEDHLYGRWWEKQKPIKIGDVTIHVHKSLDVRKPTMLPMPAPYVPSEFMPSCGCKVGTVCGSAACPHLPKVTC